MAGRLGRRLPGLAGNAGAGGKHGGRDQDQGRSQKRQGEIRTRQLVQPLVILEEIRDGLLVEA